MASFLDNLKQLLGRLTVGQRVGLGAVVVGGLAFFLGVTYWAAQPDYALLFGRLDSTDANRIVETLRDEGVKFQLKENGTAVYVPREQVYELRLRFASEGVAADGPAGYELFDQGTLGMTDFMQKLNLRRALEGELARTISSLSQVDVARVHLVMPERSPFRTAQNQTTASVVLQLAGGARLTAVQIQGISALVSSSVEGLAPADVTVLDTRGNLLSNPDAGDDDLMLSSSQLRMQRATEQHLMEKGQSMLDRVLGPGNAIVRVTAALDFDRAVSERELIDPESATVISEEKLEEDGEVGNANSSVRNYELSRTRERQEKSVGSIDFLTVSVILNQPLQPAAPAEEGAEEEAAPAAEPAAYTEAELAEIEDLVKNAVGFRGDRGDSFALHQTRFDDSVSERLAEEIADERFDQRLEMYLRYGLVLLALAVAAWLLRSAARRTTAAGPAALPAGADPRQLAAGGSARGTALDGGDGAALLGQGDDEAVVMVDDVYTSKLSPEAKARLKARHKMFEEIQSQMSERPEDTAEFLRSWLADDIEADLPH